MAPASRQGWRARRVWSRPPDPPLEDAVLWVRMGRVESVQPGPVARSPDSPVTDLGEAHLVPGFVNPHTHLDCTALAGRSKPSGGFVGWLRDVLGSRANWTEADWRNSWLAGLEDCLRHGVTTVGDITAHTAIPDLAREHDGKLGGVFWWEFTGVRRGLSGEEAVEEAAARLEGFQAPPEWRFGLSPHSPYAVPPGALAAFARQWDRNPNWPVTMHADESAAEREMFASGTGLLHDWLGEMGRSNSDCGGHSPIEVLEAAGLLRPGLLLAHVNGATEKEAALLAERGVVVVHCPRSHRYFDHPGFPLATLQNAGVRICLGTDSAASLDGVSPEAPGLDPRAEARLFMEGNPGVSPAEVLAMITVEGATALGLEGEAGQLTPGARADFVVLDANPEVAEPAIDVLNERSSIRQVVRGGVEVWPAG